MAELTRVHPLEHFGAELADRSNRAVTITPEPFIAMVDVRLPAAAANAELLGIALPTTPNTWVATSLGRAIWLGPAEWLLTSTVHDPDDFVDLVRVSVQPLVPADFASGRADHFSWMREPDPVAERIAAWLA